MLSVVLGQSHLSSIQLVIIITMIIDSTIFCIVFFATESDPHTQAIVLTNTRGTG